MKGGYLQFLPRSHPCKYNHRWNKTNTGYLTGFPPVNTALFNHNEELNLYLWRVIKVLCPYFCGYYVHLPSYFGCSLTALSLYWWIFDWCLWNLKNVLWCSGYEIKCNHARQRGTNLHVPLLSASSLFCSVNKHARWHILDYSMPRFTDGLPLRHKQTHTILFLSLLNVKPHFLCSPTHSCSSKPVSHDSWQILSYSAVRC